VEGERVVELLERTLGARRVAQDPAVEAFENCAASDDGGRMTEV